ncbi:MAG: permease [Thermoplasmatales archaeon]|nr:permease [Thermoplasmatales archaeon]
MDIWAFIQTQVLGMMWLKDAVGSLLTWMGADITTQLGESLQFFIYDFVKILILLTVLIFVISYVQSYFPPERTRRILGRIRGLKGNITGALLGTVTPFCSCSSIPVFIGFTKAGLPLGVTFSFLISSPFVDLAAVIILAGIFGAELAVAYVITGIVLAVIGGTIIERMRMEDQIEEFARPSSDAGGCSCDSDGGMTSRERLSYSGDQVVQTVRRVWKYIVIGVLIGALIHNWIPEDVIQAVLGDQNPFSVLIATVIAVPIYADIFGTIPIAEALFAKGVGAGTILAFMMGVTALSLPSIMMLRSVVKPRLLAAFMAIVVGGIMVIGYLFNWIYPMFMG